MALMELLRKLKMRGSSLEVGFQTRIIGCYSFNAGLGFLQKIASN